MKRNKILKVLGVGLSLVLVLSFSLVAAVPAGADSPADTDVGFLFSIKDTDTVVWDAVPENGLPTAGLGNYSVKIAKAGGTQPTYVEFIPVAGTTLSDLDALTNDWSFWYYLVGDPSPAGPQLELKFTSGTDFVDITIMAAQATYATEDTWEEVVLADDLVKVGYWGGATIPWGEGPTLAEALTAVLADPDISDDWELTRVRVELYETKPSRVCHIDDITIDGVTYELEPIFLDAEYYSVADTVEVTVPNFKANTDPIRVNPVTGEGEEDTPRPDWEVTVKSTSDTIGTTVALEETGANTGVFTGSFTTVDTTPAGEDELYVQDGDEITVTYAKAGDWGTGVNEELAALTLTASVDDTDPTIDALVPGDGDTTDDATPVISADYNGGTSGINTGSVEMFVDGVEVTDDATVGASSVTYTPEDDLDEGSHDVTVNVSDLAGNAATESWSFRIVSWLVDPESVTDEDSLDALETVGVAVSGAGTANITVGRYASNPEPEATPTFSLIENGFFDVQVIGADTTQIVIKFADDNITADSTAYVWDELQGAWLACSDQGYNSLNEYLWVKVRDDTTPNIAELSGTPFAISGEEAPPEDILAYYRGADGVVSTSELLTGITDWAAGTIPSGFTEALTTTQLLTLITEWAS